MSSSPYDPILFHNTMRVADGHLDAFKRANRRAVEFVEQHGPQLMVQNFVDEQQMRAHSFQLYPDSAAILTHWELSDPSSGCGSTASRTRPCYDSSRRWHRTTWTGRSCRAMSASCAWTRERAEGAHRVAQRRPVSRWARPAGAG